MLDDFVVRAALAGLGVAVATGPLGCFVVWRRMAYFGDATAHASILGVALALAFGVSVSLGVLLVAAGMAVGVTLMTGRRRASDTVLGVLSHTALATGLVAVTFVPGIRIDLTSFLFGDILAVRPIDLWVIWGGAGIVLGLLAWRWTPLLTATLGTDLAQADGIAARREQLILTLALAVTVAVAIKVVGALLISAMLLIPAAAARTVSSTPEGMAILATLAGAISALGGVALSFITDAPTGPSIVCVAAVLFAISLVVDQVRR
ncbi:metal ABC transporter permease [Jannaschia sp. KMU-145]|uniref:metal ABC transporter permease n=1 Tax=Jannaschia halovivens TaxID=3388667 RepID=UPI00396B426F